MGVAELRRLNQLEDENRRLKWLVADLIRQADAPGCPIKKVLKLAEKRDLVIMISTPYRVSERRAHTPLRLPRSTIRHKSDQRQLVFLREKLLSLIKEHGRPSDGGSVAA
jgi:hypothetical protein